LNALLSKNNITPIPAASPSLPLPACGAPAIASKARGGG
jgi:hypothetical protein